jgi:hypothetical protein
MLSNSLASNTTFIVLMIEFPESIATGKIAIIIIYFPAQVNFGNLE